MISWEVKTQKSYPVTIGKSWDFSCVQNPKVCVVTDDVVAPLYLEKVANGICGKVYTFVVPHGESRKSLQWYAQLVEFLARNGFNRNDALVALGGGVVGDLTGFVASTYQRGVDFYQVPTTLLAMVDSSVGGKTALNLSEGKNLIGSFYQPKAVLVNIETLKTLPQKEWRNGFGEVLKYALLSHEIASLIDENDILKVVEACLRFKTEIVEKDERENGCRVLLNLGHTVGHAVEALSGYTLSHGECVAKGIAKAFEISQKYYALPSDVTERCQKLLGTKFDFSLPFSKQEILSQILHDKKSFGNGINFVMIRDIGDCRIEKIAFSELEKLL